MRLKFWKKQPRLWKWNEAEVLKRILWNYLEDGIIDEEFYDNLSEHCESLDELNWIMDMNEQFAAV